MVQTHLVVIVSLGFWLTCPQLQLLWCMVYFVTEGVGWAMRYTTTFALIPVLFPSRVGTLTVT